MFGKRIRYYRLKKGLTSEELANEIGCTKGAISLYENDERTPNTEILQKLADIFGIPLIQLMGRDDDLKFKHYGFRKKQSTSKKDIELLIGDIEQKCADRIFVIDTLGLIGKDAFKAKRLSKDNGYDYNALAIRRALNLSSIGPIYSITRTLEDIGIIVLSFDCPEEIDGLNGVVNDIPYIFFNSKDRTIERQRFTLVHELCHLFFAHDEEDKELERYINHLAGTVLISDIDLYREFGMLNHHITAYLRDSVAKKYKIAPSCLVVRLFEAGIITETYYRNYFKMLNSTVGKKKEPSFLDDIHDSELPSIFEHQVYLALSDDLITASRAAELLAVPLYEVMQNARM